MKLSFHIKERLYYLLNNCDYQRVEYPNICIIDIFKIHNHRYEMHAFFYESKLIIPTNVFTTKLELYGAIQNLLQQELYNV